MTSIEKDHKRLALFCGPKSSNFHIDYAAIELNRGLLLQNMSANDQAVFVSACASKSDILVMAGAERDSMSGWSWYASVANAHAELDNCYT
jgi:hypothetical protein